MIDVIHTVNGILTDCSHPLLLIRFGSANAIQTFYCGADTVDSQTWIISEAFKQVQLPGFHLTRFSPRENAKYPAKDPQSRFNFAQSLLQLIDEEDFAVKDWVNGTTWQIRDEGRRIYSYLDYQEDRDGMAPGLLHRA